MVARALRWRLLDLGAGPLEMSMLIAAKEQELKAAIETMAEAVKDFILPGSLAYEGRKLTTERKRN